MVLSVITIEPSGSRLGFGSFYQLAFLVPFLAMLAIGIRRRYDMSRWLAIMLAGSFFFLLGTRLTTFSGSDWGALLGHGKWPGTYYKFALGGALVALSGVWLTIRFLGFDRPVFSIYAWVFPLGLAIQKTGCLLNGCCFGIPTDLPWGVKYAAGTAPHYDHFVSGLIHSWDAYSLPVHPVPLYQMALYLAITLSVLVFSSRFRHRESVILFALLQLAVYRFLLEFLIDPQATVVAASRLAGMKLIQWYCLLASLVCVILLVRSERNGRKAFPVRYGGSGLGKPVVVFTFVTVLFILLQRGFSIHETLAFNIRFLVITVLFSVVVFRRITLPRLRWISVALLALPVLLGSQTKPEGFEGFTRRKMIRAGTSLGHYYNSVRYNPHEGGCGTAYDRVDYENRSYILDGGYGIRGTRGFQRYRYGVDLSIGNVRETPLEGSNRSMLLLSFYPYADYQWRWMSLGAGLHMGRFPYIPMENIRNTRVAPTENHKIFIALPSFNARFGPYDWLDLGVSYASGFPTPLPTRLWEVSAGTGFSLKNGTGIRVGYSMPLENIFVSGRFVLKGDVELNLRYDFGESVYSINGNYPRNNQFQLGFLFPL